MGYVKTSVLAALVASLTLPAAAQNCTEINTADYKKTVLAQNLESPMKMKIAESAFAVGFANSSACAARRVK